MRDLEEIFLIGFFVGKVISSIFIFRILFRFFVFLKSPLTAPKSRYPEKQVPKSMTFLRAIDGRKSVYLWIFWCDFRNPRLAKRLYTDFQQILAKSGEIHTSKVSGLSKSKTWNKSSYSSDFTSLELGVRNSNRCISAKKIVWDLNFCTRKALII